VATLDTGFSDVLPCGRGLWAFRDSESALAALEQLQRNYTAQCAAAREIAAEYFASHKVLSSLIERAMEQGAAASPETHPQALGNLQQPIPR
jgi:hypothetical protein